MNPLSRAQEIIADLASIQEQLQKAVENAPREAGSDAGCRVREGKMAEPARALSRRGLAFAYRTGHYCPTNAGKKWVAEHPQNAPHEGPGARGQGNGQIKD